MVWVKSLLQMILYAAIILIGYNLLKHYVFSKLKVKINKWIVLFAAMVILFLPTILVAVFHMEIQNNPIWAYGPSSLFIILFLWFLDLAGWNSRFGKAKENKVNTNSYSKNNKKNDVIIRPKAKPNRVKNKKD